MQVRLVDQLLTVELDAKPLGSGAEAAVHSLTGDPLRAVKRYHRDAESHRAKIDWMIANAPWDPPDTTGYRCFAWPEQAVADPVTGAFVGFVMPRVVGARPHYQIANPAARPAHMEPYPLRLKAARGLAAAVAAVHALGHVVGDLNECNVLINDCGQATLIDVDSFQINAGGKQYRCPVGKPEYTPPELLGARFVDVDRAAHNDSFGLACLVHKLLCGTHPFAGRYTGAGQAPSLVEAIEHGLWADQPGGCPDYLPSPLAPPFDSHPEVLRQLWTRCFVGGRRRPEDRPTAADWVRAIDVVQPPAWGLAGVARAFQPAAELSTEALAFVARHKLKVAAALALVVSVAGYNFWPSRGGAHRPAANSSAARPARDPAGDKGLSPLPPLFTELLWEASQQAHPQGAPERDGGLAPLPPLVEQLRREAAGK